MTFWWDRRRDHSRAQLRSGKIRRGRSQMLHYATRTQHTCANSRERAACEEVIAHGRRKKRTACAANFFPEPLDHSKRNCPPTAAAERSAFHLSLTPPRGLRAEEGSWVVLPVARTCSMSLSTMSSWQRSCEVSVTSPSRSKTPTTNLIFVLDAHTLLRAK